jgi:uncharacterized protein
MLIYLHGLNSSSQSAKARLLAERLAPCEVTAPDYPAHRPDAAVERLTEFFASLGDRRFAVVGSSMGGFYGQYLARRFPPSRLYLINPALTPWTLMMAHLGETMTTARGESYRITEALAERFRAYAVAHPCEGVPTTLFLERGDEVIDHRIAERIYGECGGECGRVLVWDGGDHAFQHMDEVIELIRTHLTALGDDPR